MRNSEDINYIWCPLNFEKSGICCKSKWKGTAIITCSEDYMVMTFTIKDNCNGKTVGSGELWKQ